jgi:hypothetical protein
VLRYGGVAIALTFWAASLALPALRVTGGPTLRGIEVLSRGWQALDSGVYAWLANPLLLAAAIACWCGARRVGGTLAAAGCVLAVTSFAAARIAARAGTAIPEFTFAGGFYLWLASHFVLLVCCFARLDRRD